jgi:hypothetical protein
MSFNHGIVYDDGLADKLGIDQYMHLPLMNEEVQLGEEFKQILD